VQISPNEAYLSDEIKFEVDEEEALGMVDPDTDYMFVSASCWVGVVDATSDEPGSRGYRFIYDSIQMTLSNTGHGMASFKRHIKFVFLWIIFPVLISGILLFFSLRYCLKRVRYSHTELIEEQDPVHDVNYTQNPQGVTACW
jgi:hypothetical protein